MHVIHVEIHGLSERVAKKVREEIFSICRDSGENVIVTNVGDTPIDRTGATYQFLRLLSGGGKDGIEFLKTKVLATCLTELGLDIEIVQITNSLPAERHIRYI